MKQEIKEIYTRLSGGKIIDGDAYVIAQGQFGSVLLDRFVAELNKLGVKWDRRDIAFGELLGGPPAEGAAGGVEGVAGKFFEGASGGAEGTAGSGAGSGAEGTAGSGADGAAGRFLARPMDGVGSGLPVREAGGGSSKSADFAIGIDIQHIGELPDCIDYWEDEFYKMKFTAGEIAYGVSRNNPKETFAGIYSCKEALVKCNNRLEWSSIAISHDADGGPQFADYHLSISHSGGTAIAVAVRNNAGHRSGRGPQGSESGVADARGNERGAAEARGTTRAAADGVKDGAPAKERGLPKSTKLLYLLVTVVIVYLLYRDFIR